jgi:hypothetical protein
VILLVVLVLVPRGPVQHDVSARGPVPARRLERDR